MGKFGEVEENGKDMEKYSKVCFWNMKNARGVNDFECQKIYMRQCIVLTDNKCFSFKNFIY